VCVLLDAVATEATSTEVRGQFWPSRWPLASLGADCSVPGVCWLVVSATGNRSYGYDRPIVVRGDAPAPSIAVTPVGPWADGQKVTVTLLNAEPRRFGVLAFCLDRERIAKVEDHGSGDGLDPGCISLADLQPTERGVWPPTTQTFEVQLSRTLTDSNGGRHDCGAPQGCRIAAFWGNSTYLSSGVDTIVWFAP
jgi:hypothetical protein